ncbi:MAG: CRISPR-associated helicase Cas3' [Candidatus Jettenia sp.]|nr:CRISPR-associated helicase Cas3' [Candidatus Jettenia sp.]
MILIKTLEDLWAKAPVSEGGKGESLIIHTVNVINVARKICNMLPIDKIEKLEVARELILASALHDSGKAALGFQLSLRGKLWGRRHEMLSLAIASAVSRDIGISGLFAIATHHKTIEYFEDTFNAQQIPSEKSKTWNEMINELLVYKDLLIEYLGRISSQFNFDFKINCISELSLKSILKKVWFNKEYQPDEISSNDRRHASLLRGLLITADHIASAYQFNIPEIPVQKDYEAIIHRHELKGQSILPFQQRCANTEGDAILKAPTGSGKTAAILLWAAKNQAQNGRLFYVLPHTASINAMHQRLQKIYCKDTVGVLHHKNAAYLFRLFENDYSSTDAAKMAQTISGLARELYHPIRVTTPHQILRVALKGKGWELGLAEFPNACFVFDEIHTFEPLLVGLTLATVKWLKSMGAKVLFASATLPSFLEKILKEEIGIPASNIISPNPEYKNDKAVLDKIRHNVEVRSGDLLLNIETIITEIKNSGKTALIVCNHVATSQKVFEILRKEFNDTRLLHARFNAEDRFEIESIIQSENPPKILVATQAVEVSLDLNYGCGYIEPAPADALGQRLGRINRKGSRNKPPAQVVIFEEPSAKKRENPLYLPYDEEVTQETIRLLRRVRLLTEQQLTDIVNNIYGDGYKGDSKDDYKKGLTNQMIAKFDENIIAGTHKDWVEDVIEGTDGQIEVLPYELDEEFRRLKEEKRYLEASQLLVPIRLSQKFATLKRGVLRYNREIDEWVIYLSYSNTKGLDLTGQIENIL